VQSYSEFSVLIESVELMYKREPTALLLLL